MNLIMPIMNPSMFMSHTGGCGNIAELPYVLLTCVIVGIILFVLGILVNILHIKFSNGFGYTPIHWLDIKPNFDNTTLGAMCGVFGFAFIGASVLLGLVVGVYWFIITL